MTFLQFIALIALGGTALFLVSEMKGYYKLVGFCTLVLLTLYLAYPKGTSNTEIQKAALANNLAKVEYDTAAKAVFVVVADSTFKRNYPGLTSMIEGQYQDQ